MKEIKNFPEYIMSQSGDVFNKRTGHQIKWQKTPKGYLCAMLRQSGKSKNVRANRVVFETYVGKIPEGHDVNHIDGNKENNHYTNLEACTHQENIQKAVETGLIKSGCDNPSSKAVEQLDVWTGEVIHEFGSQREASKITSVSAAAISECCRGNRNTAGGYKWRFTHG